MVKFDKSRGVPLEVLFENTRFSHYARLTQPLDLTGVPEPPVGVTTKTDIDGVLVHYYNGLTKVLVVDAKWYKVFPLTTCGQEFLSVQRLMVRALNKYPLCSAALVVGNHTGISEEELFEQRKQEPAAVFPPTDSKDVTVNLVYRADAAGEYHWKALDESVSLHEYWLDFCMEE